MGAVVMRTRTKNRSCVGKRQHPTKQAALDAMWALIRNKLAERRLVHVYACKFGDHFHVGHKGARR